MVCFSRFSIETGLLLLYSVFLNFIKIWSATNIDDIQLGLFETNKKGDIDLFAPAREQFGQDNNRIVMSQGFYPTGNWWTFVD